MATVTIPFKEAAQVLTEGKAQLKQLKADTPNSYKDTQEDSFLLGWLQAHYTALYNYTLAMTEEKQD